LRSLAAKDIEPYPPPWPLVYHLMLRHDSPVSNDLGAVVAASGEASIFSYTRGSIAPMYFSTIGGDQSLKTCTGYGVKSLRTTDAEEAFLLIREGIDAGMGVLVAGPEVGLCYGHSATGRVEGREVFEVSNWSPAFAGTCQHPATNFGLKQDHYGLSAFKQFIEDVRDPEIRGQIDQAYINCHVIDFQLGGKYWLGLYLRQLARQFTGDIHKCLVGIGGLYLKVLEEAYHAEERILEEFTLSAKQPVSTVSTIMVTLDNLCVQALCQASPGTVGSTV